MAETLGSDEHLVGVSESETGDSCWPVEGNGSEKEEVESGGGFRAEIDTSAPFESVKEAVSRFGGLGFWKPANHRHDDGFIHNDKLFEPEAREGEEIDAASVEEQAAQLEKELIIKEKDTLEVLKELEATKIMVENLKSKLQMEETDLSLDPIRGSIAKEEEDRENDPLAVKPNETPVRDPSSAPNLILLELKQAKVNLTKTTNDLAEIRASVESYNGKIEKERMSLERTRKRLSSNTSKISSLEEELNRTRTRLRLVKDGESAELQRLNCEAETFKKLGETAKAEVMRVMSEIEQTKAKIKTTEIRLVAARKMKEAARAAEAVALAEIKALEKSSEISDDGVTLSYEEYSSLTLKAQEVDENSKRRLMDAALQVEEANTSKMGILKRVEEAMEEVRCSKRALEEALNKVEEANKAKLAVEEALRRWRSEHGQRRRSVQNNTKFKISGPTEVRRDSQMLDVNGVSLANLPPVPVLKPTLSIGQILSRKLMVAEEVVVEAGRNPARRKVSLGQMLGKQSAEISVSWKMDKENNNAGGGGNSSGGGGGRKVPAKRKKFGFGRFSVLLAKQGTKKKKKSAMKMV